MRAFRIALSVVALVLGQAQAGGDPTPVKELSREEARARAEQAIRHSGLPFADKYTVETSKANADKNNWGFFFRGVEDRARPGYHAIVKVDRKSGKTEIIAGE